jgi:hypothetical protein
MMRTRLLLLVPAAVVFAAAVGGTTVVIDSDQTFSCVHTPVELTLPPDFMSNSADIVVLVTGRSSAGISQEVVQSNDRSRVDINVEFDEESVAISGETVENGSLVLNVTLDGTVVNESVVVNGNDEQLVFHVDSNGIRVDVNDGVEVDNGDTDDSDANHETDGGRDVDCSESVSCTCSDSSAEISPPVRRLPDSTGTGVSVGRVIVRPNAFVGLEMPGRTVDCASTATGVTIDCPPEHENPGG